MKKFKTDMNIAISEYTREDGLTLLKLPGNKSLQEGGMWAIRCIYGPAWFWDAETSKWVISIQSGFDLTHYALPFEQAMELFKKVPAK